jgi:hypothetical protein
MTNSTTTCIGSNPLMSNKSGGDITYKSPDVTNANFAYSSFSCTGKALNDAIPATSTDNLSYDGILVTTMLVVLGLIYITINVFHFIIGVRRR